MMSSVRTFKDLLVWKKGHELVLLIYQLTNNLPPFEQFGLSNQLNRSAVSITSNISEGFSRYSSKDKIHFYYISHGSLSELENQTEIAHDLQYITDLEYAKVIALASEVGKLINSLINKTRTRK